MSDPSEARSLPGDEHSRAVLANMIRYALSEDYCVLEFSANDDGTLSIVPITDHHLRLEEMVNGDS